jgi:GNAT superfamily N-acetyltransferase
VAHRIERAHAGDLAKLPEIERAANELFLGRGLAGVKQEDVTSLEELIRAHADGLLWVAREPGGEPIGFALLDVVDGAIHLEELDVHPAHGRRGVGRALLEALCAWAERAGHGAVTLTTFREIPWNEAFYASAGFRPLAPHELGPGLAGVVRDEAARGLDPAQRVTMRRDLASTPAPG